MLPDMRHRWRLGATGFLLAWVILPAPSTSARRPPCQLQCGHRIATCVLARGGVDGRELGGCRREIVGQCRRRGPRVCPLPTRDELAGTLAAIQAAEAAVHEHPLCAATLSALPAASIEAAIAAGRDTAAALAGTVDPSFQLRSSYRARVFEKLFIQGTFGHGAAFLPLGDAVRAIAHPTRAVIYAADSGGGAVYGIVGSTDGAAVGVLLTSCPSE
jgi:hypothetical protein